LQCGELLKINFQNTKKTLCIFKKDLVPSKKPFWKSQEVLLKNTKIKFDKFEVHGLSRKPHMVLKRLGSE